MWHSRLKHLCIMFPIEMLLRFANLAIAFLIVDSLVQGILNLHFIIQKIK